jgi:hypothetical protein
MMFDIVLRSDRIRGLLEKIGTELNLNRRLGGAEGGGLVAEALQEHVGGRAVCAAFGHFEVAATRQLGQRELYSKWAWDFDP